MSRPVMRSRVATGLIGVGLLLAGAAGRPLQTLLSASSQPPRDRGADVATEFATIRGRVTAADTGEPLRIALVTVSPRPRDGQSTATTDDEGRYELRVPPGRYTVGVGKPGYVSLDFGQRRTLEQGTIIDLTARQVLTRVDVALPRGGVLTGSVFDPFGEPAPSAVVRALRYEFLSGRWQLSRMGRDNQTDDRGTFRIFGLPPGEYYVEASFPAYSLRGRKQARTYAPTFYPGSSDLADAVRVGVAVGQEVTGLDFRLTTVLTASVAGRVVDAQGRPAAGVASVSLIRDGVTNSQASLWSGRVAADGGFVVVGVSPGSYVAYASESGGPGGSRFTTTPVAVSGGDVDGLLLTLTSGAAARGRILFEQGTVPDFAPDSIQPFTLPPGFDLLPVGRGLGHVNENWTFEIRGMAGRQLVRLSGLPSEWAVSRVELAGRDVTDTPIVFPTQMPTTGLLVLLTNRVTRVTGTVAEPDGQPATDYTVIVFAAEPDRWTYPSRFIKAARPGLDATFTLEGLPPARYLAVATQSAPAGAWTDPAFLNRIRPFAEAFSLGHAERRELHLGLKPVQ